MRNSEGKEEPFFGSDRFVFPPFYFSLLMTTRFHFMWDFLGLPYQDVQIIPPKEGEKAKL